MAKAKTKSETAKVSKTDEEFFTAPAPGANPKFRRTAALSLPTIKLAEGVPAYIRVTGKIIAKEKHGKNGRELDREGNPSFISVMNVQNLETQELGQLVVGAILVKLLNEHAGGNEKYVGKCFEIIKGKAPEGKAKPYSVFEIADPDHK